MDAIGIQLSQVDQFFHFRDDVIGPGCPDGVEIPRGLSIDEISPTVAFPRFDETKIAAQRAL
jgi:hypothetical protein